MLILASLKVAAPMFTVALRYYLKKKTKNKTLLPSRVNTIFVLADYGYVLKHLINYTSINVDLGQILRENLIFLEYIFLILSSFQLKFSAFDW